jgi:hypothetical protein
MFIEYLINPYPANFSNTPASIIDPAIFASLCASGNHTCTGINGVFTAKDINNANHSIDSLSFDNELIANIPYSVDPICEYITIIANNINNDPNNVIIKN